MQSSRAPWICGSITAVFVILFFAVPGGPCSVNLDFLVLAAPFFLATCIFGLRHHAFLGDAFRGSFDSCNSPVHAERRHRLQQELIETENRRHARTTPRDSSAPHA